MLGGRGFELVDTKSSVPKPISHNKNSGAKLGIKEHKGDVII